jgi:nicotinamide-nucleotide amidase
VNVELVTIGDELLLGFTIDTNAAHLARELSAIGVGMTRRTTVGDAAPAIATAVREALDRSGAVITTGGLGPTSDDLTKPAIATIFERAMHLDEEHLAWMAERWRKRFGTALPAANRNQAMMPEGSHKLENRHGSAPGIWLEDARGRWVAMLPGVPREMRGMLADTLIPLLRARVTADRVVRSRTLRTTGIAESALADRIGAVDASLPDSVSLAYLPNADGVDLRLTARGLASADADRVLAECAVRLEAVLGADIYGEDETDLAAVVIDACRGRGLTIAVAESCTGGMLGERITRIPGSSDAFVGGVIVYANELKTRLLDVPAAMLREHGAVSEQVALAMADGACAEASVQVGVSITGIAGPTGGSAEKPIGTVFIACIGPSKRMVEKYLFGGTREQIQESAAQAALVLLWKMLTGDSQVHCD